MCEGRREEQQSDHLLIEALWGTTLRECQDEVDKGDTTLVFPLVLTEEMVSFGLGRRYDDDIACKEAEGLNHCACRQHEARKAALNYEKAKSTMVCNERHAKNLHLFRL